MKHWIVCQIGAREHYAIARALVKNRRLACLFTDTWIRPSALLDSFKVTNRFRGRYHKELKTARVVSFNRDFLFREICNRLRGVSGWNATVARNDLFQSLVVGELRKLCIPDGAETVVFCYSYAALEIFEHAASRGWQTVLGQIDPGIVEEDIVKAEAARCQLASTWVPAPRSYWSKWQSEIALANQIIVNSDWSRQCLMQAGVSEEKIRIIPLAYEREKTELKGGQRGQARSRSFNVLFLGQVNIRKGVPQLLDAMRILESHADIILTIAGPTEIDMTIVESRPNVRFIGPVARNQVQKLYEVADVFILPTLSDGFAITQLEALASEVPVIASNRCGEVVQDGINGWILRDLEPSTIADTILRAQAERPLIQATLGGDYGLDYLHRELQKL